MRACVEKVDVLGWNKSIKRICNKSPDVLDTSPSPTKKANIVCIGMLPYENITHKLKDGYQKGWRVDCMRDGFCIQGKGMHINIG